MRNNPPAPPITGDLCRVTVAFTGPSGIYLIRLDYMANALSVVTTSVLLALAAAVRTQVDTSLRGVVSNQLTVTNYTAACLSLSSPASQASASNLAGTVAAAPLPSEMGAVVRKLSLLKGQHGRGRITTPGVPVTFTTPATNPDSLNATGTGAFTTFQNAVAANVTASGILFTPVISTTPLVPGALYTNAVVINLWSLDVTLGTARRRKPGRGR